MTVLQNIPLAADSVKLRWKEPYVTAGLNQKSIASEPKGVLTGFSVVPSAGFVVNVQLDPTLNLSIANVLETTAGLYTVTVVQTSNVLIDLTAQAGTTCYIVLDAQYAVGSSSAAQVKVVDAAEFALNADLVSLAKVNVPALAPVTVADINMGYRNSSGDAAPAEALAPLNLVANGSFERDVFSAAPAFWTDYGGSGLNPFVDNTVSRSGTQSLRLAPGGAVNVSFACNPMSILPGQTARASVWIRSSGVSPIAGGTGVTVLVVWLDDTYAEFANSQLEASFTGGGTTFVQRQALVTAPAGTAAAKLIVSYNNCSGTLYVDDVEFVVRSADALAQAAVFGGPTAVADAFHTHSAGGAYGGSPNWADGTSIPAGTIESAIDAIPTAIAATGVGTSGAKKVGYTPTAPVDITVGTPGSTARVDLALDNLDTRKAGLAQPNTFTKTNTFTASVLNTGAVAATGNGISPGVFGTGGTTSGVGVRGAGGAPNGLGVYGAGVGGGYGVEGVGGSGGGSGVFGIGTGAGPSIGVEGQGAGAGAGVQGTGLGVAAPGVKGMAGTGGSGVEGFGHTAGPGVSGLGGATGVGGSFQGGLSGANGVAGIGTVGGSGVRGDGNGAGHGVYGVGGATGNGVKGVGLSGGAPSTVSLVGVGVVGSGYAASDVAGVIGFGGGSDGPGVVGISSGGSPGVIGIPDGMLVPAIGTGAMGVYGEGAAGQAGVWGKSGGGVSLQAGVVGQGGSGDGNYGLYGIAGTGTYGSGAKLDAGAGNATNGSYAAECYGSVKLYDPTLYAVTDALPNVLAKQNHIAAVANFQFRGVPSVPPSCFVDSWNIASVVTPAPPLLRITFASAMANAWYAVVGSGWDTVNQLVVQVVPVTRTATYCDVALYVVGALTYPPASLGTYVDPTPATGTSDLWMVSVVIVGRNA